MHSEKVEKFRNIIAECFAEDSRFIDHCHPKSGSGIAVCIDHTFGELNGSAQFNVVMEDEELIGYFAQEQIDNREFLSGFFIRPQFRKSNWVNEFWSLILRHFNRPFYCGVYDNNAPAIKFLTRQQGEPVKVLNVHNRQCIIFEFQE